MSQDIASRLAECSTSIRCIARQMKRRVRHRTTIDVDDLEQIGRIAVWRAAQLFDESRGFKFVTYADQAIINGCLDELQRLRRPTVDIDDVYEVPTCGPDETQETNEEAAASLGMLDDARRALLEKIYFEGKTIEEASAELGHGKAWGCVNRQKSFQHIRTARGD